jgi:glutathione S-transferase
LEWVGARYKTIEMNHESLKSSDYLALNSGGSVPLLRVDDFLLTQNVAILHYLAELFPSAGLLGGDTPRARAEVMRWLAFLNSDVHKAFKPLFASKKQVEEDPLVARLATVARLQIREYLERLDQQLEGREWIANSRSVADPYLFVVFRWAASMGVTLDGLNHLRAFAERMYADKGVRAALFSEEEGVAI